MHGMEIHTALQYRLPVTFLLFDNHAHANVRDSRATLLR